jgi:integrase
MPNFGEIQWETKIKHSDKQSGDGNLTFDSFLNYCKAKLPSQNIAQSYDAFLAQRKRLQDELQKSIGAISEQPLLTAYLAWIKEVEIIPNFDLSLAKILLEKGFIGITDSEGQVWTIAKASEFNHQNIIDAIRCRYEWSTEAREGLVMAYASFIQWLSNVTFGYVCRVEDPDLMRSNARAFPYSMFLKFVSHLKDKDRLVAKLLYFGGTRTVEEVLDLKIEDIDFDNRVIYFDSQPTTYPLHVFADAKSIIKERKKGRLFLGRQNAPLNVATIFRNFKDAAIESGVGKNFTPKALIVNK